VTVDAMGKTLPDEDQPSEDAPAGSM